METETGIPVKDPAAVPVPAPAGMGGGLPPHADIAPSEEDFGAGRPAYGDESITVGFGPIRLGIEGLSERQAASLLDRYSRFVTTGPSVTATVRVGPAGSPHFLFHRRGTYECYRMERRRHDGHLTLWSYEFAGRLDVAAQRAELRLVDAEGTRFDRGLENYLRVLTASFILEGGGFMLHGAGVVRDGRAYVFFGPSGSGKTTVTDLSPRDLVLSDDLTLVVRTARGYEAAGIPFGLAHHRAPETTASFPVDSFNMLIQAPQVRRETLSPSRALAEIAGCLPFVMHESGQASVALANVATALLEVPAHRLEFRKDPSFWRVVAEGH